MQARYRCRRVRAPGAGRSAGVCAWAKTGRARACAAVAWQSVTVARPTLHPYQNTRAKVATGARLGLRRRGACVGENGEGENGEGARTRAVGAWQSVTAAQPALRPYGVWAKRSWSSGNADDGWRHLACPVGLLVGTHRVTLSITVNATRRRFNRHTHALPCTLQSRVPAPLVDRHAHAFARRPLNEQTWPLP